MKPSEDWAYKEEYNEAERRLEERESLCIIRDKGILHDMIMTRLTKRIKE